jgi:hypothetical protein
VREVLVAMVKAAALETSAAALGEMEELASAVLGALAECFLRTVATVEETVPSTIPYQDTVPAAAAVAVLPATASHRAALAALAVCMEAVAEVVVLVTSVALDPVVPALVARASSSSRMNRPTPEAVPRQR